MEDRLRCLLVEPNKPSKEIEIENTLESKQHLVGGYIECVYPSNDNSVVFICNEEGKINGMPLNRDIGHDIIAGPILIFGDDYENGEFISLNENQILRYKMRFDKNSITQTENKITVLLLNKQFRNFER